MIEDISRLFDYLATVVDEGVIQSATVHCENHIRLPCKLSVVGRASADSPEITLFSRDIGLYDKWPMCDEVIHEIEGILHVASHD